MAIDARQFENIVTKIEALRAKQAKAEGAIEAEQRNWKKLYGVSTLEEMEAILTEAEDNLETLEGKMETAMGELEALTNWRAL